MAYWVFEYYPGSKIHVPNFIFCQVDFVKFEDPVSVCFETLKEAGTQFRGQGWLHFCDAQTSGAKDRITAHKSSEQGLCVCSPCRVWNSFCTLHTDCVHHFQRHYIHAWVQSVACETFSTLKDVYKCILVRLPIYSLQYQVRLLAINSMTCWGWLLDIMVSYKRCSFLNCVILSLLSDFSTFKFSLFSSKRNKDK